MTAPDPFVDLAVPLELVMLLRNSPTMLRPALAEAINAAAGDLDPDTLVLMQAALTSAVVRSVEHQTVKVLADPARLERAAAAARGGVPLDPAEFGLAADTVLQAFGTRIARARVRS